MIALLIAAGAIAFGVSVALPVVVKPLLFRWGVVDIPSDRSSHTGVVIRGMGLAVSGGVGLALAFSLLTGLVPVDRSLVLTILAVIIAASVLGWIEDFRGLSIKARAGAQLALGVAGTSILAWTIDQSYWWVPIGAFAIAIYINVANFMDGINGISGMHGVLVGSFYAVAGVLSEQWWLTVAGIVVAAAFAGFLPWNLGRGVVFLGDVGSYLLGASIAAMAVTGLLAGVYLEYLLSPVLIYLADTFTTFLRRIRRGERFYASHREHVYQQLTVNGLSHVQVALLVTCCSAVTGLAGFVVATAQSPTYAVGGSLVAALTVVAYLYSPRFLRVRTGPRSTGRIRGS